MYRGIISGSLPSFLLIFLFSATLSMAQPDRAAPETGTFTPSLTSAYPLKTESLIYTATEVELARNRVASNPAAQKLARKIIKSAERWAAWSDEDLQALIPPASVPRSFDLHADGCPVHGDTIFHVGGSYPWILDPRKQFKVQCPVGGEIYPSNDFDPSDAGQPLQDQTNELYVDNGWGWVAREGEKYWFVAYANQWFYNRYVQNALNSLGRAYMLTGRPEFAHKALVMLYQLAEVYPEMDYEHQSRYGEMQKEIGSRYPGKVLNRIWETNFIQTAAECYDAVWQAIHTDDALQTYLGKGPEDIQAFIEVNLLEEAVKGYRERKIQGNFGMHQMALLYVLLARQHMDNEPYLNELVHNVSKELLHTGMSYALYNFVFRDGVPMESPSYNFLWIRKLAALSDRLKKLGVNFFEDHRFQSLLKSPIYTMGTEKYTIDIGDSGNTLGGVLGRDQNTYEIAYLHTGDTTFLSWIYPGQKSVDGQHRTLTFESLFRPEFAVEEMPDESRMGYGSSRLLAGYGLGKLASRSSNPVTLALTYGFHGSHYHWDFLNFELFAFGQKIMPDFGYPDAMNTYVPGVYTWSQNTVSHNTVVVDARRQQRNLPGVLHDFADGEFARAISASSPAYAATSMYRRHMISVDVGDNQSYVVDFFRVKGGQRHDYILHGPPGYASVNEKEWSNELPGTYAGENVSLAEIYDNARMNQPNYKGGFAGYGGSGFQHLFNVRAKTGGEGVVDFRHVNDDQARLKIRILDQENQQTYLADGYNHPRSKEHLIKHVISRSEADSVFLDNTFLSVIEPYYGQSFIEHTEEIRVDGGTEARALKIDRGSDYDIVISDVEQTEKSIRSLGLRTDATAASLTMDSQNRVKRVFFSEGSYLSWGDQTLTAQEMSGIVTEVDIDNRKVMVKLDGTSASADLESLNTEVMFFDNGSLSTAHPISNYTLADNMLTLTTTDDLLIGRVNVSELDGELNKVQVNNYLRFSSLYIGAYLLNEKYEVVGKVTSISGNKMEFTDGNAAIFPDGRTMADVWIATVAPGDDAKWKTMVEFTSATSR